MIYGWSRSAGLLLALMPPLLAVAACVGNGAARPQAAGPQGWTETQRAAWYGADQGSRLMPYAWFKALERTDAPGAFAAPEALARFRFLPRADQPLPVGFATDDQPDDGLPHSALRWYAGQGAREAWVGLNCSACHTSELRFGDGPPLRIDGGPSLVDFQAFTADLDRAAVATRDDPARWNRFAAAVLGPRDTPGNRQRLRDAFGRYVDWQQTVIRLDATDQRYGYGRLDAVGRIFNKVALFTQAPTPIVNPPDAPVSYPFLWDIWRQDRLQWNGIARSARLDLGNHRFLDYGALGRNAGEVIGVFGDVDTTPRGKLAGFRSSLRADNLDRIEQQLRLLRAPRWPEALAPRPGSPEATQAATRLAHGQQLFADKCAGCHAIPAATLDRYNVTMVPLSRPGAEPHRSVDGLQRLHLQRPLRRVGGRARGLSQGPPAWAGGAHRDPARDHGEGHACRQEGAGPAAGGQHHHRRRAGRRPRWRRTFRTRPRAGSPPGSSAASPTRASCSPTRPARSMGCGRPRPTSTTARCRRLYDLLLPADRRPATFLVGTRQYDPVRVGYVTGPAAGNLFTVDTRLRGNSNAGHDYGSSTMTDEDRWSLVEYLKIL